MFEQKFVDQLAEALATKLKSDKPKQPERWPELMSVETAAAYMDRTQNAIKHLIEAKALPCCQIDRRVQNPACGHRLADREEDGMSETQAIRNYDPPGREFYDQASGRTMKLVYANSGTWSGWILYRHPDGQWVSLRKATDEDLAAVSGAVVAAHHQVLP